MEFIGRLVRNYYEIYGSFDNIYNKLGNILKDNNLEIDDLYECIGFSKVGNFSPQQVYEIRKAVIQNDKDKVKHLSNMSLEDTRIFLNDEDAPLLENFRKPEVEYREYIKLLSNYIKYSRSNVTSQGDFRDYINDLSRQSLKTIAQALNSKDFMETVSAIMPNWKYVENVEPIIQLGVFYVPEKLTAKAKKYIQEYAIKDAILNTLTIHEEYAIVIKSVVDNQITEMYKTNKKGYRAILDLAMFQGVSVKELLNSCGFNVVNYVEQYINHRCIFYKVENRIAITVFNGKEESKLLLSENQFKRIYAEDYLDYLTVVDGKIYLNKNSLTPLTSVL